MRLDCLAPELANAANGQIDIRGLTADSRAVMPGYLFAALAGSQADGVKFIDQAIARGAHAVLVDAAIAPVPLDGAVEGALVLQSDNPRRDLARMAGRFFEVQPENIAAITGTNGKTSTAFFLQQLLDACGHKAASLGTLGVQSASYQAPLQHTTPDPVTLNATLRDLSAHGVTHVALEASSHGLAQYRLDGVQVSTAGFTNLSRDHLDYHRDEADYFAAKQRLFTDVLAADGVAVVLVNTDAGGQMARAAEQAGRRTLPVGTPDAALQVALDKRQPDGLMVKARYGDQMADIMLPLVGDFQIDNLQLALGMAVSMGCDWHQLCAAAANLRAPDGRLQHAGRNQAGAPIYVDYAHTPDALANALQALRAHMKAGGALHLVFGCGGDRDEGKRPLMGSVAAEHAEHIIVTDDNPRHEDADRIRAAILATCPLAQDIGDRGAAIAQAVAQASADDIVLVAGKGHETGQIIGDTILPFNDATYIGGLVKQAIEKGGRQHD